MNENEKAKVDVENLESLFDHLKLNPKNTLNSFFLKKKQSLQRKNSIK